MTNSYPVVDGQGNAYFTAGSKVYAVKPDGTQKWKVSLNSDETASEGAALNASGSVLYVSTHRYGALMPSPYRDTLYSFSSVDGAQLWATEFNLNSSNDYQVSSPMVGPDGSIYIVDFVQLETLFCFDSGGTMKWSNSDYTTFLPMLSPDGSLVYGIKPLEVGGETDALSAVDGSFVRTILPTYYWVGFKPWAMVDQAGIVYLPAYPSMIAVTALGVVLWTSAPLYGSLGAPSDSPLDNSIVLTDNVNNIVYKLSKVDGSVIWQYDASAFGTLAVGVGIDLAGSIYFMAGTTAMALDIHGSVLWTVGSVYGSVPAIGKNMVYFADPSGTLTRIS